MQQTWKLRYIFGATILLSSLLFASAAQSQPFQGDGKDYVVYVSGKLWIFSRSANTSVTVRDLSNNTVVWSPTIAQKDQVVSRSFTGRHLRVTANNTVNIATGNLLPHNATGNNNLSYASYLISENGSRLGKSFIGFVSSDLVVFCHKTSSSGASNPRVTVEDLSDKPPSNDNDDQTLTSFNATVNRPEISIWQRGAFDDDLVRITTNQDCAVMVGHNVHAKGLSDWSVTPPSMEPGEKGLTYGTRFYVFVQKTMFIKALEDNTKVVIRDYSDSDDNASITLNRNQVFTPVPFAKMYNNFTQLTAKTGFDDDYVEIVSNKPIWVLVGPTGANNNNHSMAPVTMPMGNGQREAFCFVQKGSANNFQIFVNDKSAVVDITTMAGELGLSTTTRKVGGSGAAWKGSGPYYWESNAFSNEVLLVRSTRPMSLLCGGLGGTSWQSFVSHERVNLEPKVQTPGNRLEYTVQVGQKLTIDVTASDPNGDTLTWKQSWSTSNGQAPANVGVSGSGNSRQLNWTPTQPQIGTYFWTIEVTDSGIPGLTTLVRIKINVVQGVGNRPPQFTTTPGGSSLSVQIGSSFTYIPRAVDPDGDPVTFTMINSAPGATFSGGVVRWTSTTSNSKISDVFQFTIRACDDKNACTDQSFSIRITRVNRPPVFLSKPPLVVREGQLFDYIPRVTDPDPGDVNSLRFTGIGVRGPNSTTDPPGVVIDYNTGRITWTPNSKQGGINYDVGIVVCDPQGACTIQRWYLQVVDVISNPPKITSKPPTGARVNVQYVYAPKFTDADLPNDSHTWKLNNGPSAALFNNSTGRITWTPTQADANRQFGFSITICDRLQSCDTQTWSVQVGSGNRKPIITSKPPSFQPFVGRIYLYNVTAADPDSNENLTWQILRSPAGATLVKTGALKASLRWTPRPLDRGLRVTFSIRVCDRFQECDTQTWTSTVIGSNQPPQFTSTPPKQVREGSTLRYAAKATDPDPTDTVKIKLKSGPSGAKISNSGVVTWKPTPSNSGKSFRFVLEACDQNSNCTTQTFNVFVINVNNKPVIVTKPPTKAKLGVRYSYNIRAVDSDPGATVRWGKVLANAPGTITQNPKDPFRATYTFVPTKLGSISLSIVVTDNTNLKAVQSWVVVVTKAVNRPPKITSKPPTTATEKKLYSYDAKATDPDTLDKLSWSLLKGPSKATLDALSGKLSWIPDSSNSGKTYDFEIEVCDNGNLCAKQSWKVAVQNVNDPPQIITIGPTSARDGQQYVYAASAVDPDPGDQNSLVWSKVSGPASAKIDSSTGIFTYTPTSTKPFAFKIRVCDPSKACDEQETTVSQVAPGNRAPKIVSSAPTLAFVGVDIAYQAVAVDPDVGDTLTWTLIPSSRAGQPKPQNPMSVDKNGFVSWTATVNDYNKRFEFTVQVCDSGKLCDKQKVILTVARRCRLDINCPGKDICVNLPGRRFRVCVSPGCSLLTTNCSPQFFCKDGNCVRDKCPTPNCPSLICRPDTGCIRSCSGVTCSAGSRCIDGSCLPTPCVTNACKRTEVCDSSDRLKPSCIADPCQIPGQCKHGRVCAYDRCVDDPCKLMNCPTGQVCRAGQCINPPNCDVDVDCAGDEVCEGKKCILPGCYVKSPRCSNRGDLCIKTNCKEDPCAAGGLLQCKSDQFCRATNGKCGNVCDKAAKAKCGPNEKCVDGACERDPCAGRNCPAGSVCIEGVCVIDRCSASNVCKHGRICNSEKNRCEDDPCLYMKCPNSTVCRLGQCVDTPCRVDKDCQGSKICVNGQCIEPKCPPCPAGQRCFNGRCANDACLNKQCPPNQFCKNGKCVDSCPSCPSGTVCVDGKCVPNPCAGVKCPAGQTCRNGSCVAECCTEDSCKQRRICRACQCFDPCSITCPAGTVLSAETCSCEPKAKCQVDQKGDGQNGCEGEQVCINGECKEPGCYTAKNCKDNELCRDGECVPNPCNDNKCKEGEVCRPSDGQCVPSCKCKDGEICNNGQCSPDSCANKTCDKEQICRNGKCEKKLPCDDAKNTSENICKHGRVCKNNVVDVSRPEANCTDGACAGMKCPDGYQCKGGSCYNCTGENKPSWCKSEEPKEGSAENNPDGDAGPVEYTTIATGGCGCSADSNPVPLTLFVLLVGFFFVVRRRPTLH